MKEISVMDYVRVLLKNWLLILIIPILAMGAIYLYSNKSYTPLYESKATIVVGKRVADNTGREIYYGQMANRDIAITYINIAKSNLVAERIAEQLPDQPKVQDIKSSLQVSQVSGTSLITIKVQGNTPEWADQVNRVAVNVVVDRLNEVEMSQVATLVDPVVTSTSPIPNSYMVKTLLAGVLGLLFSVVFAFLREFAAKLTGK